MKDVGKKVAPRYCYKVVQVVTGRGPAQVSLFLLVSYDSRFNAHYVRTCLPLYGNLHVFIEPGSHSALSFIS